MLRLSIYPLTESVILLAQTRDRNGHVVDAVDVSDSATYGDDETLGFASHVDGVRFPVVDIDQIGTFDAVLTENDIQTTPALPGFYSRTMVMSNADSGFEPDFFVEDPNDATRTLWAYFGSEFTFDSIFFQLATAGSWTSAALSVQYWNGTAWVGVSGLTQGSLLNTLAGASDQISWTMPTDWFPSTIENQLVTTEGQRRRVSRSLFWVRVRLTTFVGLVSYPSIGGVWKGWSAAEADTGLWQNVIRPDKAMLVMGSMLRDENPQLSEVNCVTRKQPAQRDTGVVDFGVGDYWLGIPTSTAGDEATPDPGEMVYRSMVLNKAGDEVEFPVPSAEVVLPKGRYRVRVMAEIPNVDFSQIATDTGHAIPPGTSGTVEFDAATPDPDDPEAQFDPTWKPMVTAVVGQFDVRDRDAKAVLSHIRTSGGNDLYSVHIERNGRLVPLLNQGGANPYCRIQVIENEAQAVLIDTMNASKSSTGAAIEPRAGVSGIDSDQFRYLESTASRKLSAGTQYLVRVQVVLGGEAIESRTVINYQ